MQGCRLLVCIALMFLPGFVTAVEITEVAWMGTAVSANHEWIELYTAENIDVTDWTLSDGVNLDITLEGMLQGGQYSVLERTSDDSVSGEAWLIYTGSLVNSGATLYLRDADGGLVDQVTGGEEWSNIGGDNTTKDTAQLYQGAWGTAIPTPGKANIHQSTVTLETVTTKEVQVSAQRTSSKSENAAVKLTLPDITLRLDIGAPEIVYVNQPVTFSVDSSGVGDTIMNSLKYKWNFGQGDVATGEEVSFSYDYPGNYVVVVEGEYKRQKQYARHEIVVLPTALKLELLDSGDLLLTNNSQLEIDIGGYEIVGDYSLTFPQYTILLPQSQIRIHRSDVVKTSVDKMIGLYDQASQLVASHLPTSMSRSVTPVVAPQSRSSVVLQESSEPLFSFVNAASEEVIDTSSSSVITPAASTSVTAPSSPNPSDRWPQYTLVVVLVVAIGLVYLVPRREKSDSPWV